MPKKLVYLLPEYRADIDTHFYHNYEFVKKAQDELDIYLIVERGTSPRNIKRSYVQKFHFLPLRIAELLIIFTWLRVNGYKTFWTHYSFFGGILAPFFGKSFYWNCGMPWLYKRSRLEEYFFRLALRLSYLVTGTENLKKKYSAEYHLDPERVFVLPNWIQLERFSGWRGKQKEARRRLAIPEKMKIILFLHHLSRRKGACMIEPVAKIFEDKSDILFLVGGTGPYRDKISGPNIRLLGSLPHKDVPIYMAASDIFFMPSEEEGFPHVLLEAMGVGIPIVASDVGGVRDITPPSIHEFVVPLSPQLFTERISKILGDQKLREQLRRDEIAWVARYELTDVLKKFLLLLAAFP